MVYLKKLIFRKKMIYYIDYKYQTKGKNMDFKYLMKNKELIINSRKKIKEINSIIDKGENAFLSGFKNSFFTLGTLFIGNIVVNKAIEIFSPSTEFLEHVVGFSAAAIILPTCFFTIIYFINKTNKLKINNKERFKILKNHCNFLSTLNKKTVKNIKNVFENANNEELDFLATKESCAYLNISSQKVKDLIFNYVRENKVSKEEINVINEIIKEYDVRLDQEKLDLLLFKNNQKEDKKCIIKENMVIKSI
jgi:hypothetical protein